MRRIGRDILSNTSTHAGIRWFKLQYATHVNWAKKWTVRNATMKWIRRDILPNTHTENYNALEMEIWKSKMFSQKGWVDIRVCEGFCKAIFSKMLKRFDFLILLVECVLPYDTKVSRPNSSSFPPKSFWQVSFEVSDDTWEYGH